jgi:FMN-dependent NADH-azoreductase
MKKVLLITSSPRGEASHSTRVATELASKIGGQTVLRELWREPLPPIGTDFALGIHTPAEQRTEAQQAAVALSDALVEELQAADVVVIGAGMINFGLPATLKTWIDHITRSGLTFQYGEAGPQGLVTGKKVILVLASGAVYSSGPFQAYNHLEPTLRTNLGFLGMTDVETIWLEGLVYGDEAVAGAVARADERSQELATSVA